MATSIRLARVLGIAACTLILAACTSPAAPPPPAAAPRASAAPLRDFDDDSSSIVGKEAPPFQAATWLNSPPLTIKELRGRVVFVRWFMSTNCPLCSATAPSLRLLHETYGSRGLTVIGMYHHKDPEPLDVERVKKYVAVFGYTFPIAIDQDWKTLNAWWLDGHPKRHFTSVSFVIDRRGVVRDMHLGGKLAPDDAEFTRLRGKVEELLAEQ